MIPQVGLFAESSVAYVTLEWPASVVDVHVRFQVSRGGEGLGTGCTFVRLFLENIYINTLAYGNDG